MTVSSTFRTTTRRGGCNLRPATGALVAMAGVLTLLVGVSTSVAAEPTTPPSSGQVALHNDVANSGACPDNRDASLAYWHFVVTPNNDTYTIESINLNLDGDAELELVAATIIPNGSQPDNVYVAVPAGYEPTSLVQSGSYADVSPLPNPRVNFILSHICAATETTTTTTVPETTTTTTVPETTVPETTTTTTVPETTVPETTTTTTVPETTTTTTVPETTTTTTVPETTVPETTVPETTVPETTTTTTIVESGGPTTDPTTTTIVESGGPTTDPTVLPSTGNTGNNPMVLFGSVLTLLGGVIVLLARRITPLG